MVSTPLSVGPLSSEPGVGPAFQEQKACLASSWNRLGADGTLQCTHHVETGLAGGQMVYGTLGVCPLSPQKGRLWQFASEMGKVGCPQIEV